MKKVLSFFIFFLLISISLYAEEGWKNNAELSYIATGGNAKANTLGFRGKVERDWENALFKVEAGGLRAQTATTSRKYVMTSGDIVAYNLVEQTRSEVTAKNYFLRSRYDRNVWKNFFWFVGGGWDRNEFAGIKNRYAASFGLGVIWIEEENTKWRTDYGFSYTHQEDTISFFDQDHNFGGLRTSSDYSRKIGDNVEIGNIFIVDGNLRYKSDLRMDMINSLAVAMSEKLALKVSLQILFDNMPSLLEVPVENESGIPLGMTMVIGAKKVDTNFNVALVINF